MEILNFLLSATMVKIYLVALIAFGMYKMAQELKEPQETEQEPEDIEGHIAEIIGSESLKQAIERYRQGNRYNELRSEAFIEKMAEFHQDGSRQTLS